MADKVAFSGNLSIQEFNGDCYPYWQRRPSYIYTTGLWFFPTSNSSRNLPSVISSSIMSNCEQGGGTHSYIGLRVASIFIILVGSGMGALFPVLAKRSSWLRVPNCVFKSVLGHVTLFSLLILDTVSPSISVLVSLCAIVRVLLLVTNPYE